MPTPNEVRKEGNLRRAMLVVRRLPAPGADTADCLSVQRKLCGVSIAHAECLKGGRGSNEWNVFGLPGHVKAIVGGTVPQLTIFDVAGHHICQCLMVRLHVLNGGPVLTVINVFLSIRINIAGIAAIRVTVIKILSVLEGGKSELAQVRETGSLPPSFPYPAEDRE